MGQIMYYIEKAGVYWHGVFGIYSDLDEAKEQANLAASQDTDDYHTWEVKESIQPNNNTHYGSDSNNPVVYVGQRKV